LYKSPDVLIEAATRCIQQGLALKLLFIGDGKYRPLLEALATANRPAADGSDV